MYALKDIYSAAFYNRLSECIIQVVPTFNKKRFITQIFTAEFEQKELKERMKHTAQVLHHFMPADFGKAVKLVNKIIITCKKEKFGEDGLAFMFLPDYIETYGLNDYENAVKAFEFITQFVSCEFAVRPFILKYGDRMMKQMTAWSSHENHNVRRLSSEGSRPRLPWAMAIPELKKNPALILPILENLKKDPSESVRRSVANNLNDISKDHPDIVLTIARTWQDISKETDAIIKHGCRTLLRQGHHEILKHYGLESTNLKLSDFKLLTPVLSIGESLEFSFSIENKNTVQQTVRLEYAVYYPRKNGQLSRKIFKISERIYQANEKTSVHRKQKFILITTRKFYPGIHQLAVVINGKEMLVTKFKLSD